MKKLPYQNFTASQKSFTSSDGIIKYIDKGESEKVIFLLHGIPTSGWLYRKMIDSLVNDGFRVIAPDMLGFGNSDSPKGYDIYNPDQHAKRIFELMDSLKINSWRHVMHDVGGLWTWELLKIAPERINSLVILNTIIYEEGFTPPIRMKKGLFAKIAMRMYHTRLTNKLMLKNLFKMGLEDHKLSKSDLYGYQAPLLDNKTRGMYNFFTTTRNSLQDYSAVIKQIKVPKIVIWGEKDEMLQWDPQAEKVISDLNLIESDIHLLDEKHFIQEVFFKEICEKIKSIE